MKILILIFILFLPSCSKSVNTSSKIFEVTKGDSLAKTASNLEKDKIIDNIFIFKLTAKLAFNNKQLKTGVYRIPPSISYNKILNILTSGKGLGINITIPEGFNSFQIAYLLEKNGIVSAIDFLNEIAQPYRLAQFSIPTSKYTPISETKCLSDYNNFKFIIPLQQNRSIEGFLFPDTYSFEKNMSVSNIVNIMTDRFVQVIKEKKIIERMNQTQTLNEVITFASIIQKEAVNNSEMKKVAGVYQNRLNRKMILQADPTLIYALILDGEYNGNIQTKHLRPPWPSSYNTYYTRTLPPGPIANPGIDAICAALNPDEHEYLFFVGNPSGTHTFSITLEDHNKAVELFVKSKRK
ncbi:MAG: endolytic transglycosylase MltG [Brevinemataceae bacterium]